MANLNLGGNDEGYSRQVFTRVGKGKARPFFSLKGEQVLGVFVVVVVLGSFFLGG